MAGAQGPDSEESRNLVGLEIIISDWENTVTSNSGSVMSRPRPPAAAADAGGGPGLGLGCRIGCRRMTILLGTDSEVYLPIRLGP
jgi:hypothetical protein